MRKVCRTTNLLFGTAILATFSLAYGGDIAAGKAKAMPCFACHGENGISVLPSYPNLAGQKQPYIINQLTNFKSGVRSNPIMAAMAMSLSDADIQDLATYFSSLANISTSLAGK